MRHAGLCLGLVWLLVVSVFAGTNAPVASQSAVTISPAEVPGFLQSEGMWTNPYPSPSPRHRHAMAYDSQSDRIILFGGTSDGLNRETWAYDVNANLWVRKNPAISPSARFGHAMAYDSGSDRVVLFGGNTSDVNGETWSYNFNTDTWTNVTPVPPAASPPARYGHAMAYDSQSDRIVLFGGTTGEFSNETWSYDFDANTWEQRNPAIAPSARSSSAMAYDFQSDRIVLFGGTTGEVSNETWEYDFDADAWTNRTTLDGPSARYRHAMAYDSQSDRIILFGGYTGAFNGETWSYDYNTNTWERKDPPGAPSARSSHAMAYDSQSDRIVLFGGDRGASDDETWSYHLNIDTWSTRSPAKPFRRYGHSMAYDAGSDMVVLFGGSTGVFTDDTWSYSLEGHSWEKMVQSTRPSPRYRHVMAYDSQSDRIVLFGGFTGDFNGETWAYDLETNTWTNKAPASGPSARSSHAMAYDSQSDRIILFGGTTETVNSETWAYDLETNTWTNLNPSTRPSARHGAGMVYDSESDRVVLFGGNTDGGLSAETWAYDFETNTWTNMNPAAPPTARYRHAMVYDSRVDRTILFGGWTGSLSDATWSYDYGTNTWTEMHPALNPSRRYQHAMAYDSGSGRSVLFGGDTGVRNGETWWYEAALSPPSAPRNLAAAFGNGQVVLTWQAPSSDGGSPVTNYRIYRGTVSGSLSFLVQIGNVLTYTDAGLTNGVTYYYQVSGENGVGEGPRSGETSSTPATTPSAPRSLQVAAENGQAVLNWQSPSSDGGSAVTGYRIYRGTASGGESFLVQVGTVLTYTDTGLTNGVTYYYQVSALNAVGEGPRSDEASGTPEDVASAPQDLVATPGNAQVVLEWQAPTSDGGRPITGYTIYRGTTSGSLSVLAQIGDVLTHTDTGLTNGFTYYYQVSALNSAGEGPRSNEASATPATVPSAARQLQAVPGPGRATLTWDPPSSNGGSPITTYRLYRGTSPGTEVFLIAVGNILTYTDASVTNGVTYHYQVSALNAVGEGPRSNEVSVLPSAVPSSPRSVDATAADARVVLEWQGPASEGGTPVTGYRIYRGTSSGGATFLVQVGTVLTYTDAGLTNGVTYFYQVGALNAVGEGPRSEEVSATPVLPPDTTLPVISIASPAAGSRLGATSVTVSGTASDNVAVQKVELSTDGTNWVVATGTTSWSGTLILAEGTNTIYARATDTSGNVATVSIEVSVEITVTGGGFGTLPVIIAILGIIAAAVAIAFLLQRNRGRRKKGPESNEGGPPAL